MSTAKVFKKGDVIYKEGDRTQLLYIVQSGGVSLQVQRPKQTIELLNQKGTQIIGEHALSGATTHPHTAVATSEVKAIELPFDAVKAQVEAGSQLNKLLVKSLCDKLKFVMKDCYSMKLERDNSPCPPEQTAKVFGSVFHVAKTKGETQKEKPGVVTVNWHLMRQYAQRVFLESPKRFENAVNIFVKLGWAKYEMAKPVDNPEGPEEISLVQFSDLGGVEQVFEFYQYHHFKGGRQDILKFDERALQMAAALLELTVGQEPDRQNIVRVEYPKVIEKLKDVMGIQLNNDHWAILENKGLMVKRQSSDAGITLHLDVKEFDTMIKIWKVLREIERWNEKGSVDPNEPVVDPLKKVQKSGAACPGCGKDYEGTPKFCSECGFKFTAAA